MGVGDMLTRLAPCCKPVPGDKIIGYVTRGKGMAIHRRECPNIQVALTQEAERIAAVAPGSRFAARVRSLGPRALVTAR